MFLLLKLCCVLSSRGCLNLECYIENMFVNRCGGFTETAAVSCYCAPQSELSCFAEWKLWWNLIHKLYLYIKIKDGPDEDLHTKAGSGFCHNVFPFLWAIMRVSKIRQDHLPNLVCVYIVQWLSGGVKKYKLHTHICFGYYLFCSNVGGELLYCSELFQSRITSTYNLYMNARPFHQL